MKDKASLFVAFLAMALSIGAITWVSQTQPARSPSTVSGEPAPFDASNAALLRVLFANNQADQVMQQEASFAKLESRVIDQRRWPQTAEDAKTLREETEVIIGAMPPLMQEAYLSRIMPLRWTVDALIALCDDGEDVAEQLDRVSELLGYVPVGVPAALKDRLTTCASELRAELRLNALKIARDALDGEDISRCESAWTALVDWEADEDVRRVQDALETRLKLGQQKSELSSLREQLGVLQDLPDQVTRRFHVTQLYEAAIALQIQAVSQNLGGDELRELRQDIEVSLRELAADEAEKHAGQRREYQRWALHQIQSYERWHYPESEIKSDLQAMDSAFQPLEWELLHEFSSLEGLIWDQTGVNIDDAQLSVYAQTTLLSKCKGTVGWNHVDELAFRVTRDAMVKYLLPIEESLLEPAVRRLFERAFQKGWSKLEGREDQLYVAQQTVHVVKRSLAVGSEEID